MNWCSVKPVRPLNPSICLSVFKTSRISQGDCSKPTSVGEVDERQWQTLLFPAELNKNTDFLNTRAQVQNYVYGGISKGFGNDQHGANTGKNLHTLADGFD